MSLKPSFTLLRSRQFTFLWLGQTFSGIGNQCYSVALIWLITSLTKSTILISLVLTAEYIPIILLQVFGGILTDSLGSFRIVLWSDVLRAVATFILAVLVTLGYISIPTIIIFVIFYGFVHAFFNPAIGTLFALIVSKDKYSISNSLQQLSVQVAILLGPSLAGYLIAKYNVQAAFIFDAITFLISVLAILSLHSQRKNGVIDKSVHHSKLEASELFAGFQFFWQEKGILIIAVLASITNGLNNVEAVLVPVLARFILKLSAAQFGLLAASFGAGGIIGALLSSWGGDRTRYLGRITCGGLAVFGIIIAAMGTAQSAWQLYGEYFLLGFSGATIETVSSTLFLYLIPVDIRGRAFSVLSTLSTGLNPLGFLFAGLLGMLYGIRGGLWIGGGAIVILSTVVLFMPVIRQLDVRVFNEQMIIKKDGDS